jgi:hypothetical protein
VGRYLLGSLSACLDRLKCVESPDASADREGRRSGRRISLQTLVIASAASAAASFAASRIWGAGTLVSAAATPVVVALVSEFLRRPVQTVAASAKKVPAVYTLPTLKRTTAAPQDTTQVPEGPNRGMPAGATPGEPQSLSRGRQPSRPAKPPADTAPAAGSGIGDPGEAGRWRSRWLLAVGTGLLAFAIVVAVFTVPDLLAGRSITGNGAPSTFFGSPSVTKKASSTTTFTTTTPTTTVAKTTSTTTATKTTTAATSTITTSTSTATSTTPTTSTALPGVVVLRR